MRFLRDLAGASALGLRRSLTDIRGLVRVLHPLCIPIDQHRRIQHRLLLKASVLNTLQWGMGTIRQWPSRQMQILSNLEDPYLAWPMDANKDDLIA